MQGNLAKDSIILAIVRIITICTSMLQTMVLSRIMSLMDYGIYSQLLIVISIVTTFSNLGLNNAINYFYNKCTEQKEKYVNVIFSLTIFSGIVGALLIFTFRTMIADYYANNLLIGLIIYIIFRPLFANIISLYQALYISAGRAKIIAIRNFLISLIQTICVPLSFYIFKNIKVVLLVQLFLDIIQLIYFGLDFSKKEIKINLMKFDKTIIKEILIYSIPMGIALMMGTLFKESDKLVIAKLMDTENLAIYTNMSKQLPFEFIATSFTAVITPAIVRFYHKKDMKAVINLWSNYMEFGYITTWILCGGAIVCAKELLLFLYSDKYLAGLNIFIIYLITEMFRYTYFGMILSATGKTKYILNSSLISLVSNIILNIVFYKIFGIIGPAIASLVCVITMGFIQLFFSCKQLKVSITNVLKLRNMMGLIAKLVIVAIIVYIIKRTLYLFIDKIEIILIICYIIFTIVSGLLNRKKIMYLIRNMKSGDDIESS